MAINGIKERKKANRKRGRPVYIMLTEDEYAVLLEKCNRQKMSMSYFVRTTIMDGEVKVFDTFAISETIKELNSIGNEIRNISKSVNERGVIEEDIENLKNQYEDLINMYLDKIMGV
jgi:sRNA-binding regulator protein Hfq